MIKLENVIIKKLHYVIFAFLLILIYQKESTALSEADCDNYAHRSVNQLHTALSLNIPNLNPPVWSDDYYSHKNWCIRQSRQTISNAISNRDSVINNWRTSNEPTEPNGDAPDDPEDTNSWLVPAIIGASATIIAAIIGISRT